MRAATRAPSAVGELAILLQPVDAFTSQRPLGVRQLRRASVIAERLQVEWRTHVADAATDSAIQVAHAHPDVRPSVRQGPQGIQDTGQVASAHGRIVTEPVALKRWITG